MSKTAKWMGLLFGTAAVLLVVILVVADKVKPGLQFKPEMYKTGIDVASALFVIALFVELGVMVVYALIYGERLRQAELEVARVAEDPKATAADEKSALTKLADELTFKERLRILLTFAAGLYLSLAGVRTLAGLLVTTTAANPPVNLPVPPLFHSVDIVLTAALIAGGSNALAFIIDILKNKMSGNDDKYTALRARLTTTS